MENFEQLLDRVGANGTQEEKPKEETTEVVVETTKEVVEEVVEETTEGKVEETTEEETLQTSFSELLKETPATEEKVVEIPQEVLSEIESYKQKLADYEAQFNDPLVKAVTAGATKEQLIAIAAELNGKDYSKSSYRDLMEAEIRAEGFEGEELERQLEAVMSDFELLQDYQKRKEERELRAKFQATAKKGESPTLEALDLAYQEKAKSFKTKEQVQEEIKAIATKEKLEIKEFGLKRVGSKFWGVEITESEINDSVEKHYNVHKIADFLNDDDGKLDMEGFIEAKFYKRNIAKIVELAEARGAKKANQGTAVTKTVKQTSATVEKTDPKKEELKAIGLGHVTDAPKSIAWKE